MWIEAAEATNHPPDGTYVEPMRRRQFTGTGLYLTDRLCQRLYDPDSIVILISSFEYESEPPLPEPDI